MIYHIVKVEYNRPDSTYSVEHRQCFQEREERKTVPHPDGWYIYDPEMYTEDQALVILVDCMIADTQTQMERLAARKIRLEKLKQFQTSLQW